MAGGECRRGLPAEGLVTGNLDSPLSLEIVALAERIGHLLDGRIVRDEVVSERRAALSAIEETAG